MILALLFTARAATTALPVHPGDTVESVAVDLGDPTLAPSIRELNGLGPGEQPEVGTLLRVPDPGVLGEQQAFLIASGGEVTRTDPGSSPTPLDLFEPVPNGASICTGSDGRATVRLASTCTLDGNASDDLVLQPSTCIVVDVATSSVEARHTVFRVEQGSVAVLSQDDGRGHVTVLTPSGMTSGPSGGFRVTLEDAASRTETLDGVATVAGSGAEVALKEGQGSRVKEGQAPSEPVDLLRLDTLESPEDGAPLLRPDFRWGALPEALGYRFEIGSLPTFVEVIYQEDVPEPAHTPLTLMLPYDQLDAVHWRVAAFDRFGFLGVPSSPRRLAFPPALH